VDELARERRTAVLFEAPHRVLATIGDLAEACGGDRPVALAREVTKVFEETWRGTLEEARRHLESVTPRGEYTIVLGPDADRALPPTDAELAEALRGALSNGASVRDAASRVAERLGVPRRRAYELATQLNRPSR
jgi:16S rRNA (cytidine1402-2'-O)-methyltransferase